MENKKSAWNDLSSSWKKIGAVIAAIGVITAFIVDLFHYDVKYVLPIVAFSGFILLVISWYVDKQSEHQHEELAEHIKESNKIIIEMNDGIKNLKDVTMETRRDTVRIQLSMYMKSDPDNIDTILKIAELYFVKLGGDWYMTNEFMKWAKQHDVVVPNSIFDVINSELKN